MNEEISIKQLVEKISEILGEEIEITILQKIRPER